MTPLSTEAIANIRNQCRKAGKWFPEMDPKAILALCDEVEEHRKAQPCHCQTNSIQEPLFISSTGVVPESLIPPLIHLPTDNLPPSLRSYE